MTKEQQLGYNFDKLASSGLKPLWMIFFGHGPFDPKVVMGFGILNGTSIGLLNLSLGLNSVGFYQGLWPGESAVVWAEVSQNILIKYWGVARAARTTLGERGNFARDKGKRRNLDS